MQTIIHFLQNYMMTCWFVKHFGIECPGCGMQRSLILLLQGNFIESIKMFPALIPMLFMLSFLPFHMYFNFKIGPKVLLWSFIVSAFLMLINYSIKLFLIAHL